MDDFRTTDVRPANTTLVYSFRLSKNRLAFWGLNAGSFVLLLVFGWFFIWYLTLVRPDFARDFLPGSISPLVLLAWLLGVFVGQLLLHESIHGAFFWMYTRRRPKFGFRGWYAFAAAPGWYFPRREYMVITLAPFALFSILGMILLAGLPVGALLPVLLAAIVNAASSVGDLWISFKLFFARGSVIVEDLGDGMDFYTLN